MPKKKTSAEILPKDPQELMNRINGDKKFGPGTLTFASDPDLAIGRLPSGLLSIDYLLGGGWPRGRHIEIYGNPSTAKTTLAIRTIAAAQKRGEKACYLDNEGSFDPHYAEHLGVNLEDLTYHRQRHGNQIVDLLEVLLRSQEYGVIAIDSIAAIIPRVEVEEDMDAGGYKTAQAKLMSEALRRLTAANNKTVLLYINQVRESIGGFSFGKKWVTSGGRAMSFYASLRLETVVTDSVRKKILVTHPEKNAEYKDVARGKRILVRVTKNKSGGKATEGDTTSLVIDYDLGKPDPIEDLIYVGQLAGVIDRKDKSWYLSGEEYKGRKKLYDFLREDKPARVKLNKQLNALVVGRKIKKKED